MSMVELHVYDACFILFPYNKTVILFVFLAVVYTLHTSSQALSNKTLHSFSIQHVNKRHF